MPSSDEDKLNRIEELKARIFSKNYQTKIEHRDTFVRSHHKDVSDVWESEVKSDTDSISKGEKFFMKTSRFKKFFIFSLTFFVLTLGYAFYVFFAGSNTVSNNNIDMSVLGNNYTAGGQELSLVVGITNRNNAPLDLADLVMQYPKNASSSPDDSLSGDTVDTTPSSGTESSRQSLGTIPAGATSNENFKVTLFGQQGSVVPVTFSLEYRVDGSNAIFVKDTTFNVTINSTPINLSVDAPATISPNQDMTLDIKTTLNATTPVPNVLLKVDYPVGFQFESSTPAPSLGNNVWALGDLAPGAEHDITVTGKIIGAVNGEEKNFQISSGTQSSTDKSMIDVVLNSLTQTVTINNPFIEANLTINGASGGIYASDSKTPIQGEINWTNNSDTAIDDLTITAKLSGNAVDPTTINAQQGFYDSNQALITWDQNSLSQFKEVNPGDTGAVEFSLSPTALFSSALGLLPDPSINIAISVSGKQSLQGYATTTLTNSDSGVVRIISDLGLTANALYYSGPFTNTGPVPPKVGKETTYTVTWSLSNTSNNISNAVINSTLPPWVSFVGPISPSDEDLTYNPSTQEVVWNIGNIAAGTGITGADRGVSFQVAFTPSLSQVGTVPLIINDAILTGHDDFANVDVKVDKPPLNTFLTNDTSFPSGGGTVTN